MNGLDFLRPPVPLDYRAAEYKDWLHLNVLDHTSGCVGLINVSLHGAPDDPRARAMGAALAHVPNIGWVGNLEILGLREAAISRTSIGLERVALAIDHTSGTLLGSVRDVDNHLVIRVTATAAARPIVIKQQLQLGHGWISWYAVPRLTLTGEWTIDQERMSLAAASAYHDHNWGRWHWGDDLGWEW